MGYTDLKAIIDANIKTNGRQSITGARLNQVMTDVLQGVDILDRANPADTSGMGHVVLKRNKTFVEQLTATNTIYEIRDNFDLAGANAVIPAGCLLLFNGGRVEGGSLEGNQTSVVPLDMESRIFVGITFAGSWVDSSLSAVNFGFVNDLSYVAYTFNYKGVQAATEKAQGTDNSAACASMSSFLTGARNIRIKLNGGFYLANSGYLELKDCDDCEIYGGTLVGGINVLYSRNIDIHDINFAGYHKPHILPKLAANAGNIAPDVFHPSEGLENLGMVDFACVYVNTSSLYPNTFSEFVNVHDCNFEMHSNGVTFGKSLLTKFNRNCSVKNCSFDTIYYQPVGFHGEYCFAENIFGRYCGQAIDFSSYSHNNFAKNVISKEGFGTGIKVDSVSAANDYTYGNVMEDCDIEVVSPLHVDTTVYAILCNGEKTTGKNVLSVDNCKFYVSGKVATYTGLALGLNIQSNCVIANTAIELGTGFDYGISLLNGTDLDLTNCKFKIASDTSYMMRGYANTRIAAKGCSFENEAVSQNRFIISTENANGFTAEFRDCTIKRCLQLIGRATRIDFINCDIDVDNISGSSAFNQGTSVEITYSFTGCNIKVADLLFQSTTTFLGSLIFHGNMLEFQRLVMTNDTDTNLRTLIFTNNVCKIKRSMTFNTPSTPLSENSAISGNVFMASGVTNPWIIDFSATDKYNSFCEMAEGNIYIGVVNPQVNITSRRATSLSARKAGYVFFDTTLGKSLVWNGSAWVNMDGTALA